MSFFTECTVSPSFLVARICPLSLFIAWSTSAVFSFFSFPLPLAFSTVAAKLQDFSRVVISGFLFPLPQDVNANRSFAFLRTFGLFLLLVSPPVDAIAKLGVLTPRWIFGCTHHSLA